MQMTADFIARKIYRAVERMDAYKHFTEIIIIHQKERTAESNFFCK